MAYTKAVLCGGGIKGWAELGSLMALRYIGALQDIDTMAGTSVGGLMSAIVALGYDLDFVADFMSKLEPLAIQDGSTNTLHVFDKKVAHADLISRLITKGSAMKGDLLHDIASKLIANKLGKPNATFKDLEEAIEKMSPEDKVKAAKFRHLIVTATVKNDKRKGGDYQIVLSAETVPNMPIAEALRMTSSFPIGFASYKLSERDLHKFQEGATKPLVQYKRGGKFLRKDPYKDDEELIKKANELGKKIKEGKATKKEIELFNDLIHSQVQASKGRFKIDDGGCAGNSANLPLYLFQDTPDEVIGLNLASPKNVKAIEQLEGQIRQKGEEQASKEFNKNTSTLSNKIEKLYTNVFRACKPPPDLFVQLREQIASPNTLGISPMDFGISREQKLALLSNGYEAVAKVKEFENFGPYLNTVDKEKLFATALSTKNKGYIYLSNKEIKYINSRLISCGLKDHIITKDKTTGGVEIYKIEEVRKAAAELTIKGISKKIKQDSKEVYQQLNALLNMHSSIQNEFSELLKNADAFLNELIANKTRKTKEFQKEWPKVKKQIKFVIANMGELDAQSSKLDAIQLQLDSQLRAAGKLTEKVQRNYQKLFALRDAIKDAKYEQAKELEFVQRWLYRVCVRIPAIQRFVQKHMPNQYAKIDALMQMKIRVGQIQR